MASATTDTDKDDQKAMATDVIAPGADDAGGGKPRQQPPKAPAARSSTSGGFFHIYKKGQGYWTRMGTVAGALVIVALVINFLWTNLPVWLLPAFDHSASMVEPAAKAAAAMRGAALARDTTYGICAGFVLLYALLVYWVMNKPTNADFLIATDSEMKKVNWTSKKELWGSTKVVILFMFLIAIMLFVFDVIFGYFFYLIHVLKSPPF